VSLSGNLFSHFPPDRSAEQITALLTAPNITIERIVSTGQASPPGFWYDQDRDEWVIVLAGSATLRLADEAEPRHLIAGDYLHIVAHRRHRIESTDAERPTIWLAVHYR